MTAPTLRALWLKARARLAALPPDEAERDARLLVQEALRLTPTQFVTGLGQAVDAPQGALDHLNWMLDKRAARCPVSHILGRAPFWGRDFEVTADTLAPRGDSEALIAAALERGFHRIADLGTGTGCLAITLLAERPQATGIATDISGAALKVAARNAARHGVAERLEFRETDWLAAVTGRFDMIVSNPPYITQAAFDALAPEVRAHEPRLALTPGGDGLAAYDHLCATAPAYLEPGGWLLFEIGFDQGPAVATRMQAAGFEAVTVIPDFAGNDRVVAGHKPLLRL